MVIATNAKQIIPDLGLGRIIQNKIKYYDFNNEYGGCFINVEILRIASHAKVTHTNEWLLPYCAANAKEGKIYSTWFYFNIKK